MSRPAGVKLPHWVSFCSDDRDGILLRALSRVDRGMTGTVRVRLLPGSLMASLTPAPVAVARVTAVCPLSQCTLVPPPVWRGPRATSEQVDGRVQDWDTITETSVKVSDAINPQGWEKGSLSETSHFLWLPFGWVFQQSRLQQRIQGIRLRTWGVRRSYAVVRGAYAVRGFDSHDFFEGRFFVGFCRGFRSCRGAGEGVLFPGQRRAQSLQEGQSLLRRRASGPANRRTSRRDKFRDGS